MRLEPLADVTGDQIEQFRTDGVVCLRGVLDPELVASLAPAVDRTHTVTLSEGFAAGTDHWNTDPDLGRFACAGPLRSLTAALVGSERLYLYEDSVLVKEPGSDAPTMFHQDLAYFCVDGRQIATTWTPLDRVTAESGATRYVVGSHLDPELFRPNLFVDDTPIDGTEGPVLGLDDPWFDGRRIVSFDVEPGDVIVHHARTVHGAYANTSARRRRAVSVRYCGDDVRHLRRGFTLKPWADQVADGDPLGHEHCPQVWGPDIAPDDDDPGRREDPT